MANGSGMVIPMVIKTTQPAPPEPNGTDDTPHVISLNPTGADHSDADHSPSHPVGRCSGRSPPRPRRRPNALGALRATSASQALNQQPALPMR